MLQMAIPSVVSGTGGGASGSASASGGVANPVTINIGQAPGEKDDKADSAEHKPYMPIPI